MKKLRYKMKNLRHSFLLMTILLFSMYACGQSIPYTEAKNYFVKNTYPKKDVHVLRITNQKQFDDIFRSARVMGKNGAPTPIDFEQSFVIALIDNVSNMTEKMDIISLKKDNNGLRVMYDLPTRNEPDSAYYRYFKVLIVDKKYDAPLYADLAPKNGMPAPGSGTDEKGCIPSTGYSWSVLENDCVAHWESKYFLDWTSGTATYSTAIYFSKDNKKAEILWSDPHNIILTKKDPKGDSWEDETYLLVKEKDTSYVFKDKKNQKILAKGGIRDNK